ncbi:MAG: hypothetical protein JWR01_2215 [Subtercola sp.]|nr:hypothetical protein [Subtercola sp.]
MASPFIGRPENWPSHTVQTTPWRNRSGRGSREDRVLTEIGARIPPAIGALDFSVSPELEHTLDAGIQSLARLEADAGPGTAAISTFLIRTESIASSRIEHVGASMEEFARALFGIRSNESATSMVAASRAYTRMTDDAGRTGTITRESLLAAHRTLMAGDAAEFGYAGIFRDVQNWIGGNDFSPTAAVYIPPPPEFVDPLMDDLLLFVNRDDVPIFTQAAIAHAQFESIHPFTDGNGRVGRSLIGAILRRRGYTRSTTPPIASVLAADQSAYFALLDRYRDGDPQPIIRRLAEATAISSDEAAVSVRTIRALPDEWALRLNARAGSTAAGLLPLLMEHPVISAKEAEDLSGASSSSVYTALDRLENAGIVHQITQRQRNRVWAVTAVLDELDDLDRRIGRRAQAGASG